MGKYNAYEQALDSVLRVSRLDLIEIMNKWGISIFDDSQELEELRQEVEQAELILNQH